MRIEDRPEPYGTIARSRRRTYAGKLVRLSAWIRTDAIPTAATPARHSCCPLCAAGVSRSRLHGEVARARRPTGSATIEAQAFRPRRRASSSARCSKAPTMWVDDFEMEVVEP
jgi:hypothetical protein